MTAMPIPALEPDDIQRFRAKTKPLDNGCVEWTGAKNSRGCGRFGLKGRTYFAHRVAYAMSHGSCDPELLVDHKCHNTSCVNAEHLQLVTSQQNSENRFGYAKGNYSHARGVSWRPEFGCRSVQVGHNGRVHYGGYYKSRREAVQASLELRNSLMSNNLMDRT